MLNKHLLNDTAQDLDPTTQGKPLLAKESFLVSRQDKEKLSGHKAFVLWFTGLSGSGKSTIARKLEKWLFDAGIRTAILDGDNTRMTINHDLDFSTAGRHENIRRVAEMAKLLNDAGVVVITAFISPFEKDREMARKIIGIDCYKEIFIDATLEICIERDTKGLYKKALSGEILDFTGINSPYERPQNPNLIVPTSNELPEESVSQIFEWLSQKDLF